MPVRLTHIFYVWGRGGGIKYLKFNQNIFFINSHLEERGTFIWMNSTKDIEEKQCKYLITLYNTIIPSIVASKSRVTIFYVY